MTLSGTSMLKNFGNDPFNRDGHQTEKQTTYIIMTVEPIRNDYVLTLSGGEVRDPEKPKPSWSDITSASTLQEWTVSGTVKDGLTHVISLEKGSIAKEWSV